MNHLRTALALTASAALAGSAHAAVVGSFASPTAIDSNNDIINAANIITAINAGSSDTVSVTTSAGAVNFVGGNSLVVGNESSFANDQFFKDNNTDGPGSVIGGVGDDASGPIDGSDFHKVLDSFNDNGSNWYYEFSGLAAGTYNLQVFQSDDRGNRNQDWQLVVNPGVLGETVLDSIQFQSYQTSATEPNLFRSVSVVATITLSGGDDTFAFRRASDGEVNALVLTLVPEPSSLALLGLGTVLIARRRRA